MICDHPQLLAGLAADADAGLAEAGPLLLFIGEVVDDPPIQTLISVLSVLSVLWCVSETCFVS
jgi:hypothetical protein